MPILERGDVVGTGIQQLVVEECGVCAVLFAFPETLREKALADHSRRFFCPNGHNLAYLGKTEAEKLKDQLDRERDRSARLASQRDQVEASLRATRGVVTRMRNRASAGLCPCCNRTFQQLARHMAAKHPEFVDESPEQ